MTIPFEGVPLHELGALARRVEDAGYDGLWSAESTHYDGFTPLVPPPSTRSASVS